MNHLPSGRAHRRKNRFVRQSLAQAWRNEERPLSRAAALRFVEVAPPAIAAAPPRSPAERPAARSALSRSPGSAHDRTGLGAAPSRFMFSDTIERPQHHVTTTRA